MAEPRRYCSEQCIGRDVFEDSVCRLSVGEAATKWSVSPEAVDASLNMTIDIFVSAYYRVPMGRTIASDSDRTRRRILRAAAAAFREHGVDQVGVRDVMKRAGLTRGGFYFHFADKDALLAEATREAAQSNAARHLSWVEGAPKGRELQAFVESYLSEEHRDHPERGCVVAALGGDIGRGNARQRKALTEGIDVSLERIATYLPGATPTERRANADLLMSSMAGVLMVSRALSDRPRSDALLAAARQFYSKSFGGV